MSSGTPANTSAAKKPITPANARRPSANPTPTGNAQSKENVVPSRSPSRMAPQASATGTGSATSGVNRTRSVRNGAPVSARAAARKPAAEQNDTAMEDLRAEMQAKLDDLQERLQASEAAIEDSHKSSALLQHKLDEALKEQSMLEETAHEQSEKIEELENSKKESLRARRELEGIYEAEKAERMKEKEDAVAREEELQGAVQRMKESLAQREMRAGLGEEERRPSASRSSSFRSSTASPNPDSGAAQGGQFAPPSSLQRSDSRSSSKLVMQKDKIIESLRLELAEAQIKLVEMENLGGGRLQQLQKEMYDTKMQNARLMEENESFQLLLSEKTLNGDFAHSDLLRPPSNAGSRASSRHPTNNSSLGSATGLGTSLADELADETVDDSILTEATGMTSAVDEQTKKLQQEVGSLKDQNKALTLYINNIISRLLQHEQFEQILDKTPDIMAGPHAASTRGKSAASGGSANVEKDLPPPPPEKDDVVSKRSSVIVGGGEQEPAEQPQGFLQRARSVMGGGRRARPLSTAVSSSDQEKLQQQLKAAEDAPKATEDPSTAPRIPIGRSNSTRAGGGGAGHRRAHSEWAGAASVVTNMYRGPSPSLQGPVSPGLSSPTGMGARGGGIFAQPQPLGSRVPSGSTVPTISENEGRDKENAAPLGSAFGAQRDSKVSASHRSSVISNPGGNNTLDLPEEGLDTLSSNPSSPPRSTTSSGDRESRSGGAIMMGSKPRPLRLVQDAAAQEEAAKKASNRGSWFGWMNKGGAPPPAGAGERSVSGGQGQ